MNDPRLRPESVLVHAGRPPVQAGAAVNEAITLTSTYVAGGELNYGRDGHPTTAAFEAAIAALETPPSDGSATVSTTAFASGMAAAAALVEGLPTGSVVVAPTSYYNFHRTLLAEQEALGRLTIRTVDITDTAAALAAMDGAALVWLETPTNPGLAVPDLPALTAAARAAGALSVVDATVATPLGLRPLEFGADVSMHSATKWIGGHSDLLMGLLSTADPRVHDQIRRRRTLTGAMPGALEAYLALRGLRTLSVRLERACASAAELATRLAAHPAVTSVASLADPRHPQAERVSRLLRHRGAMLSFTTDSVERADALCSRVHLITHATSLGGVESLIERRGRYDGERAQHTPPELVRLSVGIEHVEDLWDDLAQALE